MHHLGWLVQAVASGSGAPGAGESAGADETRPGPVTALAYSPDGALLVTGAEDGLVRLVGVPSVEVTRTLGSHDGAVTAVAFAPDGRTVATGGADTVVKVWDTSTGALKHDLIGHSAALAAIAFSPDGGTLATSTTDGIVRLWDASSGLFQRALRVGGRGLAFSADGSTLACGAADGAVKLVDWRRALQARAGAVDLIPEFERLGLTPRGQRARPTCSVFTTVEALEWAVARRTGKPVRLSVEYLNWAGHQVTGEPDGDGHFFHNALAGLAQHGICPEDEMPYREKVDSSRPPSDEAMAAAAPFRDMGLEVHWVKEYGTPQGLTDEEFAGIKATLDSGYPAAAGADHSVLFVGYFDDPDEPGGGAFLVLDSGGPGHYREKTYAEARETQNDVFWVE